MSENARDQDTAASATDADVGPATEEDVAREAAADDDETMYAGVGREGDDTWLVGGLASMLLLAGVVLFLFPEPATSAMGVLLMITGAVVWVATEMR